MEIKEKDCNVRIWTEVHCEMVHVPTGISVQEKDKSFPEIKKVMFNKLKEKLKGRKLI